MEQLTQNLKDGKMQLLEVPYPALSSGCVLVRNHFSLISAGTEGKTVKDARLSYIGKARARKEEVKKVIEAARTFGIMNTYRMVMNKLDSPSALGYSTAGQIIAVAADVRDLKVGDWVACGGQSAVHAEVVAVPINLVVKVDEQVPLSHACFTTLGAIAMQGIRQADVRLGENAVVIGLGLLGQLTIQILNAAGVKTIGIDVDKKMVQLAQSNGATLAIERTNPALESLINDCTDGYGTDAVIITAGTDSTDPIDLAGVLCRKKGKVVVVGAVPTGFKRPNYFKKELDLRMSSSYGPGRYDMEYEEGGIDYPIAYVRWTENRNMQAFVELLKYKKIDLHNLLTHTFEFENAPSAYDLIINKTEPYVGMVLKYNVQKPLAKEIPLNQQSYSANEANIGLIGAGSFGQNFLLPAMKGHGNFISVCTARPNNARNIADKYGFKNCTGEATSVMKNNEVNTIFIATRHDSHAAYVLEGIKNNKNVFVEKPLCLTIPELEEIKTAYESANVRVMVGFNRRFAPLVKKIKSTLHEKQPIAINYRINSGNIPADHWVHQPNIGGGRIIGEACHFIDLCMFLTGSPITNVSANALDEANNLLDTVSINLSFANGSIANIAYFSNGSKSVNKEYLEVFGAGQVSILDDFKKLTISGKKQEELKGTQDKGHQAEVAAFLQSIKEGKPAPISFEEIYASTHATFKVLESIALSGTKVFI